MDISRSLMLVEFGRIPRLVELGKLLRYRVDFNKFFRF